LLAGTAYLQDRFFETSGFFIGFLVISCGEKANSGDKRVDCRAVEHGRAEQGEPVLQSGRGPRRREIASQEITDVNVQGLVPSAQKV